MIMKINAVQPTELLLEALMTNDENQFLNVSKSFWPDENRKTPETLQRPESV